MHKIRYLLVSCLFMLHANYLWATEGITRDFKFHYVHLSITQNDASFREAQNLLFKGRAMLLNDLIRKKIVAGNLDDVRLDIQIYDPVISRPQLIARHSVKKCEIILSGYPTVQQLYNIVIYIASHQKDLEYSGEGAAEQIAQFYTKHTDLTGPPAGNLIVWSKSGLSLFYHADSLQYLFNNVPLQYPVNGNLPLQLKDRFLLFTKDAIHIVRQGKQIATIKIEKPIHTDFDCNVYSDWVNICNGGPQNWYYSYTYRQNKFFKNPKYLE